MGQFPIWIAIWAVIGLAVAFRTSRLAPAGSRRPPEFVLAVAFWPLALIGEAIEFAGDTHAEGSASETASSAPSPLGKVVRALRGEDFQLTPALMRRIFWVAAGSFVPLLFLQYVGEEPFYIIFAQEMWAKKQFATTTIYNVNFGRPGVYSWLILALSGVLGQDNMLVAARLVTMTATVSIGLTLAWLVQRIFKDRLFAALAAAVFLSGDVLLYRGWLAYADPLFSFFVFGAMACLWVATEERNRRLLLLAVLSLAGAFLAKALTCYVFYGVFALVLLWRHPNRLFLLHPYSLLLHVAAVAFPLLWNFFAGDSVLLGMLSQILFHAASAHTVDVVAYLKLFVIYPFRISWGLLPVSALALYCIFFRKVSLRSLQQSPVDIAAWALALNIIPYWLSPSSSPRYIMPLYPLFALLMTSIVLRGGEFIPRLAVRALIATVAVAYVASLIGFPLHERYIRGNYAEAADMIIARIGDQPLYATDYSSLGISIAANLNAKRAPKPPVTRPPDDFSSGYVLSLDPDTSVGQIDLTFAVGRNTDGGRTRYLLCRGPACARPPR